MSNLVILASLAPLNLLQEILEGGGQSKSHVIPKAFGKFCGNLALNVGTNQTNSELTVNAPLMNSWRGRRTVRCLVFGRLPQSKGLQPEKSGLSTEKLVAYAER